MGISYIWTDRLWTFSPRHATRICLVRHTCAHCWHHCTLNTPHPHYTTHTHAAGALPSSKHARVRATRHHGNGIQREGLAAASASAYRTAKRPAERTPAAPRTMLAALRRIPSALTQINMVAPHSSFHPASSWVGSHTGRRKRAA